MSAATAPIAAADHGRPPIGDWAQIAARAPRLAADVDAYLVELASFRCRRRGTTRRGRPCDHECRHHAVHSGVACQAAGQAAPHEIAIGHDPDQIVAVCHGERADTGLFHEHCGAADRLVGADAYTGTAHRVD